MKCEWITLLCVLHNVLSLELGTSSVPATSIKKINRGRHKPSRIPNYPMESSIHSESLPESFFPDVVYPTTILDATQPFYYSQHGYNEVLGPFSNDIKSSYKTLAAGKEPNPSIDFTVSLLTDHKNAFPLNKSINNDTSDTIVNESYDHSSCLEDDPGSEQNNTCIIVNENGMANSTLNYKDQHLKNQETFQDISEEFITTNKEYTMDIVNSKSKEIQDVEENLQWNIIPMEKQTPFGGLVENLLERDTLHGSVHGKNYQDYIYPNSFITSEINTNQDDKELTYTNDTNILNFTSAKNNSLLNRNLLDILNETHNENIEQDIESLYTNDRNTTEGISLSSNNIVISGTSHGIKLNLETSNDGSSWVKLNSNQAFTSDTNKDQQDTLETANNNEPYNTNNQEDTELLYSNRIKHLGPIPNYIVTSKSYNQDIIEKSDTADADNNICVNLTTDKVSTSNTKDTKNTTEKLDITNDNKLCNLNNQEDMKTDLANNYVTVCIDLTNHEVITSDTNKHLNAIEMLDITNNNESYNANNQKDTCNSQDIRDKSDTAEADNIIYVNLTSNEVISDTNENQKSSEKLDISNSKELDTASNQENTEILNTNSTQSNITEDISSTTNYIVPPDTNQEDTELSETTNLNEKYVNITSNYVLTSNTGNTQEDVISDTMNICSLIEETLRGNN